MIRRHAGLVAIVVIGFLVRIVSINKWPLWSDEALTLIVAQWPLKTLFLVPVDPTPGLYYALHKVLLGPLVGVAAARSISLAAGTLLIIATYFLAKQARLPALLASALVALSFPLIDYSQEARAYSLLVLLVILSAGFFLCWAQHKRRPLLVASLMLALLAFYTHFTAIFWMGPLALTAAWIGKRAAVTPLLATGILAIPEVSRLAHYHRPGFSWLLQATPLQAADTLSRAFLPFRASAIWALPLVLVVAWRVWAHRAQLNAWAVANRAAAAVLLILLAVPLEVWMFGFVLNPIFMTRTILIAVPGFLLALALLLKFEHSLVRVGVVALYAASLLVTGTTRPKEDWRVIAERVRGGTVLMCQLWQVPAIEHALSDGGAVGMKIVAGNGEGLLEFGGEPWQIVYFRSLTNDEDMLRARLAGQRLSEGLYPVWPVRNGSAATLSAQPTTLGQAIQICGSHPEDNAQKYEAE